MAIRCATWPAALARCVAGPDMGASALASPLSLSTPTAKCPETQVPGICAFPGVSHRAPRERIPGTRIKGPGIGASLISSARTLDPQSLSAFRRVAGRYRFGQEKPPCPSRKRKSPRRSRGAYRGRCTSESARSGPAREGPATQALRTLGGRAFLRSDAGVAAEPLKPVGDTALALDDPPLRVPTTAHAQSPRHELGVQRGLFRSEAP